MEPGALLPIPANRDVGTIGETAMTDRANRREADDVTSSRRRGRLVRHHWPKLLLSGLVGLVVATAILVALIRG